MKKSYNETDWTKIKELKDVQEKYDYFLIIYEQGVKEYVPFYEVKKRQKWFNESVKELKRKEKKLGEEKKLVQERK